MRFMNQNEKAYIAAMNGLRFSNSLKARMSENLRNMCASGGDKNVEYDRYHEKTFKRKRRLSGVLAAAAAVVAVLTVTVLAAAIIRTVAGYNGNLSVRWGFDEDGNPITQAHVNSCETDIFELRDDRVWFIANEEEIEITQYISPDQAWLYTYFDDENITHYLAVGGAPEKPGWAEFLRDEKGEWIVGTIHDPESGSGGTMIYSGSNGVDIPPDNISFGPKVSCAWYANLIKDLGLPH